MLPSYVFATATASFFATAACRAIVLLFRQNHVTDLFLFLRNNHVAGLAILLRCCR